MLAPNAKQSIEAWLLGETSRSLHGEPLVAAFAEQLIAQGMSVVRLSTSVVTKHPEVWVNNIEWERGRGSFVRERRHTILDSARYKASPVAAIHDGVDMLRCQLEGPEADRFVLTQTLRDGGATDYFALALLTSDGQRTFMSWACDAPGGFTEEELALLQALRPLVSLRFELEALRHTMRSLLDVYLGKNAAEHVLSGEFRRGTGELVPCAIIFSDMRGFTEYTARHSAAEVVATLDRFFEVVAGPIQEEGGEILKFIGDAVLAVFRVDVDGGASKEAVCARAFRASERALAAVGDLNASRSEPLALGMALHYGSVMYGNIGALDRLDFTVIGAAVNEACRIEALCKPLGSALLMSAVFREALGTSVGAKSLGSHALKGVAAPLEVYRTG